MLVKNKAFSVLEIVLLLVFTIIIASSIYLTHKYTTRISNTMTKLKLLKTQVSAELNYGNGHIAKQKSQNGLYALTNIS
ncbi:hypothetical protein [Francisella tularensis]|uniref:Prepilin-type N-terminal cleavage/methylation domain-containing protein n=2 Tax=Francisella tularensis TaxID=263 RepID=A0AAW3D7I9_FRATU|nr:hypothetical protein [Francisella tularensis]ADA78746.1 hypothetical protein NE061598_06100 [Francisella tularensis subsp. tularensis NE061598]AJI62087.1 hypothetical protein CH65_1725 [Francisella tularensis subsp. tularensis]AJI68285.1 hypothetical protein BZ14_1779 [Francisella tularensis subsp. tularensis SCHU S4]AJI71253.1 hypothetical protein CH69_946 [Francisella tularensis subsp. tularensis]AKU74376.1 hypothetical protein ACX55_1958 [Francisella tularensis subsp. tularensis]